MDDVPMTEEVLDSHCKEIVRLTAERDELAKALLMSYLDANFCTCNICHLAPSFADNPEVDGHADSCPVPMAHRIIYGVAKQ